MLAQLVEQRTFNPFVVGSTPAHPTKNTNKKALRVKPRCFFSSVWLWGQFTVLRVCRYESSRKPFFAALVGNLAPSLQFSS